MNSSDGGANAIQSIGIDQVSISEMELLYADPADCERFLTSNELLDIGSDSRRGERLATCWCIKEAVLKTIGGIQQGISMKDIQVHVGSSGEPNVTVSGHAKEVAKELGIEKWLTSTSHAGGIAMGFAVALGGQG